MKAEIFLGITTFILLVVLVIEIIFLNSKKRSDNKEDIEDVKKNVVG